MKRLLITGIAAACLVANSYGQGTVNFDNSVGSGGGIYAGAPVLDSNGLPVGDGGTGASFFAQLYAAAGTGVASSSLVAVGTPVNFTDWGGAFINGAGIVDYSTGFNSLGQAVNAVVTIPASLGVTAGGPVTLQMRAWWGGGNVITSFDQAVAIGTGNGNNRFGWSNVLNLGSTGNPNGSPPGTPVDLTGLVAFQLNPVPEPTTLAFAGLGAVSLLLFRRRK